jgi:hypothetical protein
MLERLHRTAARVCGYSPGIGPDFSFASRAARRRFADCVSHAVKNAVERLNAPVLSRAYVKEINGAAQR